MTITLVSAEGAPVPPPSLISDQHEPLALRSELVGATGTEDGR